VLKLEGLFRSCTKYRVFQKELYNGIPNVNTWRVLRKSLHLTVDSLYAFKCKRFRNTRDSKI
jgi:hypothetical protein